MGLCWNNLFSSFYWRWTTKCKKFVVIALQMRVWLSERTFKTRTHVGEASKKTSEGGVAWYYRMPRSWLYCMDGQSCTSSFRSIQTLAVPSYHNYRRCAFKKYWLLRNSIGSQETYGTAVNFSIDLRYFKHVRQIHRFDFTIFPGSWNSAFVGQVETLSLLNILVWKGEQAWVGCRQMA